jgi:16S rRNA G1207 methylase RsmC
LSFFYLKKIKKIFPRKNNSVLDFGCGDGYLGLSLKKSFSKIYFSDFDSSNNNLHSPKNNLFYIPLEKVLLIIKNLI